MGAVYLALLYLATAATLTVAVRGLRLDGGGLGRIRWPGGPRGVRRSGAARRGASPIAAITLALLPLAYTAAGFVPGRALAPTPLLAGVAPWADPDLEARVTAGAEPANALLLDPVAQMLPWRRAARDGLLFNPAQGAGAALLGNGQSALLFPTEALARLLTAFRAVTFSQAARLLLAGWGMFVLARRLALSEPAALAAAAVYLGSGFLQLWRLHPHSLVAAVAPWIVVALLALVRRPGARPAVALAAAGAAGVSGGHPETLLHVLLFALLLAALVAWRRDGRGRGRGRTLRRWGRVAAWGAAAALLAWLVAAPLLLPMIENLTASAEWTLHRAERRQQIEVALPGALERLAPAAALLVHGDPRRGTWSGPENLAELGGGALGGAALLLAPLALSGRRRRLGAALLALGVVGLLVAAHVPWLAKPFGWLPLVRDSLLKRLTLWWALAAALAAALAVERLRRAGSGRGAGMGAWLTGSALVVTGLVAGVAFAHLGPETPRLLAWELGGLAAALAGAALLAAGPRSGAPAGVAAVAHVGSEGVRVSEADRSPGSAAPVRRPGALVGAQRPRWRRPLAVVLLAAALVVPRVGLFDGWVPVTSADSFYPETLATRFVSERLAELGAEGWRVAGLDAALVPHSAAFFGFEEVRSYDPMTFAPFYGFQAALGEPDRNGWVRLLDPARPALAFLGVRYVFDHPSMTHRPGVEVAYLGRDAIVYENPRALPRLFVPAAIEVHGDPGEALAAARAIDDFAARAVAAGPVLDLEVARGGAPVGRRNGRAEVLELEVDRGRVRAVVEAEEPALIASSQPAIPGWRLTVDGEPAEPVRVDGAFLGVEIPAGRHPVELLYAPASWRLGLWMAVAGALIAIGLLAAPALQTRRRRLRLQGGSAR